MLISARFRDLLYSLKIYPAQSFDPILIEDQGVVYEYYALKKAEALPSTVLKSEIKKPGAKRVLVNYAHKEKFCRLVDLYTLKVKLSGPYDYGAILKETQSVLSADFAHYDMILLAGFHEPVTLVSEKAKELLESADLKGVKLVPAHEMLIDYDREVMAELPAPLTFVDIWQKEIIEKAIPRLKSKKLREFIHANTRPALHIDYLPPAEQNIPPLASKLLGNPSLPPGFDWPQSPSGAPLAFIAQFNLENINEQHDPNNDFRTPRKGMLTFFLHLFDAEDYLQGKKGYSRVCYFPETATLIPTTFPSEASWMNDLRAHEIFFRRFDMFPDERSPVSVFNQMNQMAAWGSLDERIENLGFEGFDMESLNWHLFGYPTGCQASMEYDAAYQTRKPFYLEPAPSAEEVLLWKPLFNFSADKLPELKNHLGDGDFCFLIRQEDWESLRFDDIQVVGQWT